LSPRPRPAAPTPFASPSPLASERCFRLRNTQKKRNSPSARRNTTMMGTAMAAAS
jgi:hypothetical protein